MDYYGFRPYVPVAKRRLQALREVAKRTKSGQAVSPVVIDGRTIAKTFWGKSWCDNLESYSDYSNRLPRGRTYVRNGSVVDLQIKAGEVHALVSGSSLYKIQITIAAVPQERWKSICEDCSGSIDSLVELLQGKLSKGVMERICRQKLGLFPAPSEIGMWCTCQDSAGLCKHLAAVMYGVGARFDHQPELLFRLRAVNEADLIAKASSAMPLAAAQPGQSKVLAGEDLGDIFGIDMAEEAEPPPKMKKAPAKKAVAKKSLKKAR